MVAPKGGRLHRRAGWVFVSAMLVVSATALVICGGRLIANPTPNARFTALFLGYLAILTGAGAYKGVRVLRTKSRRRPTSNVFDLAAAAAVLISGLAMTGLALAWRSPFLGAFAVLGVAGGL